MLSLIGLGLILLGNNAINTTPDLNSFGILLKIFGLISFVAAIRSVIWEANKRKKAKRDLTIIRSEIKDFEIRINEKAQIIEQKQKV